MRENLRKYDKPEYFKNRELSWVQFNERVLSEGRDRSIPLFERLKFLSIVSSNLDEFMMVRVASLKDMQNSNYTKPDNSGMTPTMQLAALSEAIHKMEPSWEIAIPTDTSVAPAAPKIRLAASVPRK